MKLKTIRKVEDETNLEITGATLLSIEEAKGLADSLRAYGNWWWLRSCGHPSDHAAYIHLDGSVYYNGYTVYFNDITVRPALKIKNLKSTNLKIGDSIIFGDKEFEVISDEFAFCKTDIGKHCFREDYEAEDANDYEKSDIKEFIDKWFEQTKMDEEVSNDG